jgi:hypothetical protein
MVVKDRVGWELMPVLTVYLMFWPNFCAGAICTICTGLRSLGYVCQFFGKSKFRSPFCWKINLPNRHALLLDFIWPTVLCFLRSVPDFCYVDLLTTDQQTHRPTNQTTNQPFRLTYQPTNHSTNQPTDIWSDRPAN